jgi:hypothetical protein
MPRTSSQGGGMKDLFGSETIPETRDQYLKRRRREERTATGALRKNPMIRLFGETQGKKCKECLYLCYREFAKRYYKCQLRGCSGSATTDHRVNWPACGRFILHENVSEIK